MAAMGTAVGYADGQDAEEGGEEDARRAAKKNVVKARTRDSLQALSKLAEHVDGNYRIVSQPPIVDPGARARSSWPGCLADQLQHMIHEQFRAYRATLQDDRRHLLERFEVIDVARKVVGVGSVGTRAFIVLLQGRDQEDPLFLQVKEATASVLEDHLPKSRYKQHGERVVQGQRMMQAASDIYLGWTKGVRGQPLALLAPAARHEGLGRRGVAGAVRPRRSTPRQCGWTLARAHARSGDPIAIAAYLGKSDAFDRFDHRLLRAIRGSERAGLSSVRRCGEVRTIGSDRRRVRSGRDPMVGEREHPEHGGVLSNLDMKVEGVLGTSATQVLKVGTRHVDGLLLVGRGSDGTRFQRADRRWVRDPG